MTPYVILMKMENVYSNVDAFSKIVSLQCSCIRRSYDQNVHSWKIIRLYLIDMHFSKDFKFRPNLYLRNFSLKIF